MNEPHVREGKGPPNPFYQRVYTHTCDEGPATLTIPAPGNKVSRESAEELIKWLNLVLRQLRRDIQQSTNAQESTDG
jgi:hypothetical protein